MSKLVNYPIRVPEGNYCFQKNSRDICQFYYDDHGCGQCELDFWPQDYDKDGGVIKPECCKKLEEVGE